MTEQTTETTDQTEQTESTEQTEVVPAEAEAEASEASEPEEGEGNAAGKEAAKYRRRLREAEKERDTLAGQVEAMQRAEAERVAGAEGVVPKALWSSGAELAALLNDDGTVDATKVQEAVKEARDSLGLPDPRYGNTSPNEGKVPTYRGSGSSFADAFRV